MSAPNSPDGHHRGRDGLVRLGASDERDPVNLGNPVEMTILQFAESVRRLMGSNGKIVHKELPSDDPRKRRPDISKAKRILGWTPVVDLEKGLSQTMDYFKALAASSVSR